MTATMSNEIVSFPANGKAHAATRIIINMLRSNKMYKESVT